MAKRIDGRDVVGTRHSILADEVLTLRQFELRSGMGIAAIRAARRREQNPLKVRKVGIRSYICGSDWLAFCESSPTVD